MNTTTRTARTEAEILAVLDARRERVKADAIRDGRPDLAALLDSVAADCAVLRGMRPRA
jgi:hypothetical protein